MMIINRMAVEITRKCNLECQHCLRGCSEDINIDTSYIDSLLGQIKHIHHLAITGGEPSLALYEFSYLVGALQRNKVSVDWFYIATNGVELTEAFIIMCKHLYKWCNHKEDCALQISNDIYHHKWDESLVRDLPFYSRRFNEIEYYADGESLHKEGKGAAIKRAKKKSMVVPIYTVNLFNDAPLYLNVHGEIINGCDWSFENQSKYKLCNVSALQEFYNDLESRKLRTR